MDPVDDWTLVARAQRGDLDAFSTLIERYQSPVVRFCYRMVGVHADAEDIAQDAFVRLHRALPRLAPDAKFSTVLFSIVRNTTLNFLRDSQRRGRGRHDPLDGVALRARADGRPDVRSHYDEVHRSVVAGLETLSPNHREVLLLRDIEGLDYETIAAVVGCRKGTIKSRIARAREQLRAYLEARGVEPW